MSEASRSEPSLGDLIILFYEQFLVTYNGDEDLASLAAAAAVNDMLSRPESTQSEIVD